MIDFDRFSVSWHSQHHIHEVHVIELLNIFKSRFSFLLLVSIVMLYL